MSNIDPNIIRFAQNAQAAKRIMQMDMNGNLDKIKHNAEASGKMSYDSEGQVSMQISENNQFTQPKTSISKNAMKLPKEILESMTANPIGSQQSTGSILDELNAATSGQLLPQQNNNQITETLKPINEPTSMTVNNTIDYSMIRMICEETMRKYISSLKKSILTESKTTDTQSSLKAMKIGDKFSFITDKGEIYEAKLEYKGNINKKATK